MIDFKKTALICGVSAIGAIAVGQVKTGTIPTGETQVTKQIPIHSQTETGPAIVESTWDQYPQIQITLSPPKEGNEHGPLPPVLSGTSNTLTAGGMLSTPSAQSPKIAFNGPGYTGFVPPDPDMAVGPNQIIGVVNTDMAFYTKSGTKLFQTTFDGSSGFFGSLPNFNFTSDPKVVFDKGTGRWYVGILGLDFNNSQSGFLLAVSDDADPRGSWFKYRINTKLTVSGADVWSDYPGFGYNKDFIAFGANMFGFTQNVFRAAMFVVNKAPLLTGGSATTTSFTDPDVSTIQFARTADADLNVLYGIATHTTTSHRLYAVRNNGGTPLLSQIGVTIPSYVPTSNPATSTSGRLLDGLDSRLYLAAVRRGKLVTAHNVRVSSSTTRNMSRWYQIDLNNWPEGSAPKLNQAGSISSNGTSDHNWVPAININKRDAIGALWSKASTSVIADMLISGRKPTDPKGFMGAPIKVSSSSQTYGVSGFNRWGDYFAVDVDPVDDLTFWGIGMVGTTGGEWKTIITNWTINVPVDETANIFQAQTIAKYQGSSASGTVADVRADDAATYNVVSAAVSGLGQVAGAETTFNITQDVATIETLSLKIETKAPLGATCQIFLWNWATGKYDFFKSYPMPTTSAPISFEVPSFAGYLQGGAMKVMTRTISPQRNQIMPAPYVNQTDLIQVLTTNKS